MLTAIALHSFWLTIISIWIIYTTETEIQSPNQTLLKVILEKKVSKYML